MARRRLRSVGCISLAAALLACGSSPSGTGSQTQNGPDGPPPASYAPTPLQKRLAEMEPQKGLVPSDKQKQLATKIDAYYQRTASRRYYVHTDKPLYQPGETIWFRVWELATRSMTPASQQHGVRVELVSPKGASVLQKRLMARAGLVTNDFIIPSSVQGGEYTLRVTSDLGGTSERKVIVSTYQPPQFKKKLEFLRKAYGAGDRVTASLKLARGTGEPLANKAVRAIANVDGQELKRFEVTTNDEGLAVVRFELPDRIRTGDGLLTILVDDGGITESIQRRIPITVKNLSVDLFPEGGDLVEGLPSRVYFAAKNPMGKPADIRGRVVDDRGKVVAKIVSLHNGMGRFELTPQAGRSYRLEVQKPAGIATTFQVPEARADGCTMQAVDDYDNQRDDVRVGVWCSEPRTVIGSASLREKRLGDLAVNVAPGAPSVMALPVPAGAQGAVRFTIFGDELAPLAERLIYKNRGSDLRVELEAKKGSYSPRDEVALQVVTRDAAGKPVEADLSLAVVDDTVLSFADDKTANLQAEVYLESEMPGQEIEEPNFYFGKDKKAPYALDMVLGTQGWRRFEWQQVLEPAPTVTATEGQMPMGAAEAEENDMAPRAPAPPPRARPGKKAKPRGRVAPNRQQPMAGADAKPKAKLANVGLAKRAEKRKRRAVGRGDRAGGGMGARDKDWADAEAPADELRRVAWAPVRKFPVPNYSAADHYDGPRTDFRETIMWAPSVKTDDDGKAVVRFHLSDAVTSFRAIAEGVTAGGTIGRGEATITSKLPVSLAVKMPNEVSAGDTIRLPITLTNETRSRQTATLASDFGKAFKVVKALPGKVTLGKGERRSLFAVLKVVGDGKTSADGLLAVRMDARRLKDEVEKTVKVVPLGFPQDISLSGTLADKAHHEVELGNIIPGTIDAKITLYPSPVASMMKGMEAIIREPHGCFEQTSSANYPNIMVLSYLDSYESADPAVVAKAAGMLDRGYKRLVGYESKTKGYEWFGQDPGHEALTAYGLLEFADMKAVYPSVDGSMIRRTRSWLKSRRDGKGGYKRNKKALDSFGRASVEVTNGYITYALSEAGEKDLGKELAYQKKMAKKTKDPYLMALAANTLANLEPSAASTRAALDKLARMQKDGGVLSGASHSITRSGGQALNIETTSLALLAFLDGGDDYLAQSTRAAQWLNQQRNGFGGYGSTQSTILALKALTSYTEKSRKTKAAGRVKVRVNGKLAGSVRFEKGHQGALEMGNIGRFLRPGNNDIELELDSKVKLPYSVAVEYRSKIPPSSAKSAVKVRTSLSKSSVPMGEGVRMNVKVHNLTAEGQPMTVARVGIPGGTRFQTWQLKELRDKGVIGFYETKAREVVLYFRDLKPGAKLDIPVELIAEVPGRFTAPASRAYLYYTDEYKSWAEAVQLAITR